MIFSWFSTVKVKTYSNDLNKYQIELDEYFLSFKICLIYVHKVWMEVFNIVNCWKDFVILPIWLTVWRKYEFESSLKLFNIIRMICCVF